MLLQPIYDNFTTTLPSYSHNLHAFYVYLAFNDKLCFSKNEEVTINSFFGRKGTIEKKGVASSFYFHIKSLKEDQKDVKCWRVICSHANDIAIYDILDSLSQDSNEELSVSSSDGEIVDISDDYEVDPFLKVINKYKSFLQGSFTSELDSVAKKIFENIDLVNRNVVIYEDPLCNGIVYYDCLKNHPSLFRTLKKDVTVKSRIKTADIEIKNYDLSVNILIEEVLRYSPTTIPKTMNFKAEDFEILKLIDRFNYIWSSNSYKNSSVNISEKTYCNDVAFSIIDFSLPKLVDFERRYDGTLCQSTRNRNGIEGGPTKYPDFFSYFQSRNYEHFYEFFFCEVSFGPFNYQEKHANDDFVKLFKFAIDSLNHDYNFLNSFKDFDDIFEDYKRVRIFLFHFYSTKLEIYIVNRDFWPLARMHRLFEIELPIICHNRRKTLNLEIVNIVKKLEYIRDILNDNLRLIGNIDLWLTKNKKICNLENNNNQFIKTLNSPKK